MLLLVNILNVIQNMVFYFGIKIYSDFSTLISSRCTMSVMFSHVLLRTNSNKGEPNKCILQFFCLSFLCSA